MWEIGILDGNISELTTVKYKGTLLVCYSLHIPFYSLSVNMIKLIKLIHVVFKSFINNHWTGCCMHVSNNANMINDASNFIQIVVYIVFSVASLVPFIKSDCCFCHMHIANNVNIRKYAPDYRTCVYVHVRIQVDTWTDFIYDGIYLIYFLLLDITFIFCENTAKKMKHHINFNANNAHHLTKATCFLQSFC